MGPGIGIWRRPPAYLEDPEVGTRLATLPTSGATAAGKGDQATFENATGSSGICLDTEDSDKGELEVQRFKQGSGKGDSNIKQNKDSRKGHWIIEIMILHSAPHRTPEQGWSVGTGAK